MKKLLVVLALLYSSFSLSNTSNNATQIAIPLNNWESQRVVSRAIGKVLESSGFAVSYLDISSDMQWGAIRRGTIDFQLEVWEPSMKARLEKFVLRREVVDLGEHRAKVTEDWWYPKYVEQLCPGLPDWRALNRCKSLFENKLSNSKGTYISGPWDYGDGNIIRALNIDFTITRVSDSAELWRELTQALATQRPIILLNWSPNWTDEYLEGEFVQFPVHTEACDTDPQWGINRFLPKDCANPKDGWLKKVASTKLKSKAPCVYQFIQNISFSNEMLAHASYLMVVKKLSDQEAALKWLSKFSDEVNGWKPENCGI